MQQKLMGTPCWKIIIPVTTRYSKPIFQANPKVYKAKTYSKRRKTKTTPVPFIIPGPWHHVSQRSRRRIGVDFVHERRSFNTAGFTRRVNSSFSGQNDRHFTDDIFKYIFLNENIVISIEMSLKFIPSGPISDIPALVQIMAWRRPGDKPLSEQMLTRFTEAYIRD